MIKFICGLGILATVTACPQNVVSVSEACGVLQATLFEGGKFTLSSAEVEHLTRANKVKIVSVKSWYKKHCEH
jgi:hypothetical protein